MAKGTSPPARRASLTRMLGGVPMSVVRPPNRDAYASGIKSLDEVVIAGLRGDRGVLIGGHGSDGVQERTITVSSRHQLLKAPELVALMTPALDSLDLKQGHRWEIGGEIGRASCRERV